MTQKMFNLEEISTIPNNKIVKLVYKNVSDLSEKIIKISKDEKLRKKIGKKGKQKYLKY